ncbi:hypothetical protein IAU60_004195 [Kwoniella sp. DSM 27419]
MSDPRFARLKTDPRFRRPKQKDLKVEIDDRFKDVLESEEFGGKGKGKGKVDKRGRPLAGSHHADQLKRFYRLRSPAQGEEADGAEGAGFVDYARGEGQLYSSGDEDESDEAESEVEEAELELGAKKRNRLPGYETDSDEESESGSEGDHLDIDLSENEESAFPPEADQASDDDEGEEESVPPTSRIAAVNLDWDNLRAADLFAVFNSFLNAATSGKSKAEGTSSAALGRLLNVKIYPSQFGKERMEREEQEGPGGGIFVSKHGASKKKKGPKEAIILQRDESGDEDEDEDDDEDEDEEDDEDEETDEEGLSEGSQGSEQDDEEGLDSEEDEDEDEEDGDEDEMPARSSGRKSKEIDGLEIISDVDSDAGSEDIDMDQLRQYQLERLRYFYAIATFSSVSAAEYVMAECNGTEFERTANVMDLSYVPEEMDFDADEVRDEATKEPKGYKGNDFVTDALRHSKVKLTWDQDDPNRVKMTRRTLTREEIEEQDFKNLVASSGSEASEDDFSEAEGGEEVKGKKGVVGVGAKVDKKSKKAAMKERTAKLREMLLKGDDEEGDIWGKAGTAWADELKDIHAGAGTEKGKEGKGKGKGKKEDLEITFKPGLSTQLDAAEEENMTSLERYQMRMKEKRNRKKEKMELKRAAKEGSVSDAEADSEDGEVKSSSKSKTKAKAKVADDFFGSDSEEEVKPVPAKAKGKDKAAATDNAKSSSSKVVKTADRSTPDDSALAALVGAEKPDTNFSMKDILKSEKEDQKKRKRRRGKKGGVDDGRADDKELGPEGWKIDVKDDRFKALHEDAEFAIDPSNPHYTKTKAMQDLLAERSRLRQQKNKATVSAGPESLKSASGVKRDVPGAEAKDLDALVASVKRKMGEGGGKRKRHRK